MSLPSALTSDTTLDFTTRLCAPPEWPASRTICPPATEEEVEEEVEAEEPEVEQVEPGVSVEVVPSALVTTMWRPGRSEDVQAVDGSASADHGHLQPEPCQTELSHRQPLALHLQGRQPHQEVRQEDHGVAISFLIHYSQICSGGTKSMCP